MSFYMEFNVAIFAITEKNAMLNAIFTFSHSLFFSPYGAVCSATIMTFEGGGGA